MLTANGLTSGKQVQLTARTPGDNMPAAEMLQVSATLIARDADGTGNYNRIGCDQSGRLKTLFGAHIALRYRTPETAGGGSGLEEQTTPIAYGIALNRVIVFNTAATPIYLFVCDTSSALAVNAYSYFPPLAVPALSHVAFEWLYPITTTSGLVVAASLNANRRFAGAGNVACFLVECSS